MFIVHVIEILFLMVASYGFAALCFMTKKDIVLFAIIVAAITVWAIPANPEHTLFISLAAAACLIGACVRCVKEEFHIFFAPPLWVFSAFGAIVILIKILQSIVQ